MQRGGPEKEKLSSEKISLPFPGKSTILKRKNLCGELSAAEILCLGGQEERDKSRFRKGGIHSERKDICPFEHSLLYSLVDLHHPKRRGAVIAPLYPVHLRGFVLDYLCYKLDQEKGLRRREDL